MSADATSARRRARAVSAAAAVIRGSLAQNRLRTTIATLAIALGVALGFAVQLINRTAVAEMAQGVRMLSGEADLEVRGPRMGFDESIYPRIARMPEVAVASPIVEVDAKLADREEPLRILGIDVFRAALIQPALVPAAAERLDTLAPDRIFPSNAAARWLGVARGDVVRVQVGLAEVALTVAGELAGGGAERFAVVDIAGAQAAFGRLGRLSRIDVRLRPGVDAAALRERLARELPPGVAVTSPQATLDANASLTRSYRTNLDVLALVALFTGGLLVFSTQAHAVVLRRAQFALLRVLGLTRARLVALVVGEGALVGAAGSLAGLAAGFALAALALASFGADLGSGYFRGVAPAVRVELSALGAFFALGVGAAVLGSLLPAIEAARSPPALALKAGDAERVYSRLGAVAPGLGALALGGLASLLPPVDGLPLAGYAAIGLLLIGTLMLLPRIAAAVLARVPRLRAAPAALAIAQLARSPGQASVSLAAIVAGVSLTVSMVIMVASFRGSFEAWLERILPADLYVRAAQGGETAYLDADAQAAIAALPGVRHVDFLREQPLLLDPARPRVVLQARAVDRSNPSRSLPIVGAAIAVPDDAAPPAWVSETAAGLYGFTVGRVIELPIGGRRERFTVAGVWRDYARQQGAVAIERARYDALTGDATATNAALWLDEGEGPATVEARLRRAIRGGGRLEVLLPGDIRRVSLAIFDRTFAVTYALELAAVVIGLVGLSSSFGALVLARRREFGVLRHLGMTRAQVAAMLATEGFTVSAIALAVGSALGFAISLILIHVVNRQSFHWTMELALPWRGLAGFAGVLLAAATLTALASGRQAMSGDVVRAVKDDW